MQILLSSVSSHQRMEKKNAIKYPNGPLENNAPPFCRYNILHLLSNSWWCQRPREQDVECKAYVFQRLLKAKPSKTVADVHLLPVCLSALQRHLGFVLVVPRVAMEISYKLCNSDTLKSSLRIWL